jgi:hypothetical protein
MASDWQCSVWFCVCIAVCVFCRDVFYGLLHLEFADMTKDDDDDTQIYMRPWVGLTKDEVETLSYKAEGNTWIAVELAEAKLKEKNT